MDNTQLENAIIDLQKQIDLLQNKSVDQTQIPVAGIKSRHLEEGITTSILESVYPIGSIYISTVSTDPAELFGFGTWVAFGTGRTLVGVDITQTEFDTVEETGGEKTHTLTTAELAVHTHVQDSHFHYLDQASVNDGSGNLSYPAHAGTTYTNNYVTKGTVATNQNAGSGTAHNNLMPYVVVFCWKRTA